MPSLDLFTFLIFSCPLVVLLSNESDGSIGVIGALDAGLKNHSVTSTFDCDGGQVNVALLMESS